MRLEGLIRNPPPEFVPASIFFNACLGYEAGRFGDSMGVQESIKGLTKGSNLKLKGEWIARS